MIRLFCGYDRREQVGYDTFLSSVRRRASVPVDFNKVDECGLGQRGTNAFTLSRFLVPLFCHYQGRAIFCDASDQVMLADVAELDALFEPSLAVQVVQHPTYQTRHRTKYVGTDMECPNVDYPRKNWASVMLINCEHPAWRMMIEGIDQIPMPDLLRLRWLGELEIGALPDEWNRLVDEGQPVEGAKILHWTAGIPAWPHYANSPGADVWRAEAAAAT